MAADQSGALSGSVRTPDGRPVAGAAVTLEGPARAEATTDDGGRFAFAQLEPGPYVVRAAKSGFERVERDDVIVVPGAPVTLAVTLTPASFSSLQTIGRVSTNVPGKISLNTTTAALDVIPGAAFQDQGSLQVTNLLEEAPGVSLTAVAAGGGENRASLGAPVYPQIRGALQYETESLIDGHPVSVGAIGTFSPILIFPSLLQSTEIAKGPGAMPIDINYAVGGTVNYRTLEPTKEREFTVDAGADRYGGVNLGLRATGSTAADAIDYAFAYEAIGTPGPLQNYQVANSQLWLALSGTAPWTINGMQVPGSPVRITPSPFPYYAGGPGGAHFSDPLYLCCSPVNSGFSGRGELGKIRFNLSGQTTLTFTYLGGQSVADYTGIILGSATPLINFSTFAPPAGYSGSVPAGTPIPFDTQADTNYTEFLQQNLFQAELRSSIGATTLLGRAYSGYDSTLVDAFVPGQAGVLTENAWGGIALCPAGSTAAGAGCTAGGAAVAPVTEFFNGQPVTLTTTNPASFTLLLDHVRGYSLEADRTLGAVTMSLSGDVQNHDSYEFSLSPGQALDEVVLPPGSGQQFSTLMLRLEDPIAAHLDATLATYYTSYASHYTGNGGVTWSDATHAGVIPRFGLSWRPDPDTAWRLAAGGSIAPPYISLLSSPGTTPVHDPAGAAQGYFINANNGQIAPEKAFGYDLGVDRRLHPTLRLSTDLYFTNVSNMFLTETSQQGTYTATTGNSAGIPEPLYVTQTANLGNARYEGLEAQLEEAPQHGFGYKVQGSFQRAFVYGLSPGFYYTTAGPYTTNLGIIQNENFQASGNGFNAVSGGRIPYSQGYAELNFRGAPGSLYLLGYTYFGPNNAYNEPAFGVLSA